MYLWAEWAQLCTSQELHPVAGTEPLGIVLSLAAGEVADPH